MKITWIGQSGLLFEKDDYKIIIDPYLSDSVEKVNPQNYRRAKINHDLFQIRPNMMIFTHNHLDHYDPDTAEKFITKDSDITVLSPFSVWNEVRKIGGNNNYVMFNKGTVWTENGIEVTAVKAEHSDAYAVGVIINDGARKYYVTGDTLYNKEIFKDIPDDIYAVFLPVNGLGNNMNITDAEKFCERINPHFAVPVHCGMFDNIDVRKFNYKKMVVPEIYKEVIF